MPKTLRELMEGKETATPFSPVEPGNHTVQVVDAKYQESRESTKEPGKIVSPSVRMQLKVTGSDVESEIGRTAFVTLYIDQDDRRFGFARKGYRLLAGEGLLDSFSGQYVSNDDIAQRFAAGVVNGQVTVKLGVYTNQNTGEEQNQINKWIE